MERAIGWKPAESSELAKKLTDEMESQFKATIPLSFQTKPGFTPWFPITILAASVEPHLTQSNYIIDSSNLMFNGYIIFQNSTLEELQKYRTEHQNFLKKYRTNVTLKTIAKGRISLNELADRIKKQLEEFENKEYLPGSCSLCN